MKPHCFEYSGEKGARLDRYLVERFSEITGYAYLTRSQIASLIERGLVNIDGKVVNKAGFFLRPGMSIEVFEVERPSRELAPYDFKIPILYEDQDLIVIDKPPGISMHPGAGRKREGTVVNSLYSKLQGVSQSSSDKGPLRPGVVHRLDKDTTGVVVLAKNVYSHQALAEQFAKRSVTRRYVALVLLSPRATREPRTSDSGRIDAAIGRHKSQPTRMAIKKEHGRSAVTHWQVKERMKFGALLELRLETGRTHQIRVHLESIGCPVIGDKTYGDFSLLPKELKQAAADFGRQALHAAELSFLHPSLNENLSFSSKLPDDFERLVNEFRSH